MKKSIQEKKIYKKGVINFVFFFLSLFLLTLIFIESTQLEQNALILLSYCMNSMGKIVNISR